VRLIEAHEKETKQALKYVYRPYDMRMLLAVDCCVRVRNVSAQTRPRIKSMLVPTDGNWEVRVQRTSVASHLLEDMRPQRHECSEWLAYGDRQTDGQTS